MKIRVMQIWGFLMAVLGWIFVACSMAMEGWKIASIGGMGGSSVIKVAWYWSSLWRSCFTDSTSVSNCYDFPVLWSVEDHVQIVRGLLMAALVVGMLGFVVSIIGMECTFIGGKDKSKHKKIFFGGFCHITSGTLSTFGYAVYAIYVSGEYYNPGLDGLQYDLGTPLFLGWVGSAFQSTGGTFYLVSVCKVLCDDEPVRVPVPLPEDAKSLSSVSAITSKTKVSTVSELSSKSALSDVSAISSASARPSPGRSSRSGRSERSRSSSRSVSSLSNASRRSEKGQFIKNSYI
ncbi:claudin-10 isoform X2 [Hypomesus transpacificus]|uniref:claudin-10 isoform X2 n=1 Tax=Hypomesus transpacificus TaxID=137520 RepID=UPI001F07B39C|nr:claudin-10 isoform X2 [Hypomesus transpacificus]